MMLSIIDDSDIWSANARSGLLDESVGCELVTRSSTSIDTSEETSFASPTFVVCGFVTVAGGGATREVRRCEW